MTSGSAAAAGCDSPFDLKSSKPLLCFTTGNLSYIIIFFFFFFSCRRLCRRCRSEAMSSPTIRLQVDFARPSNGSRTAPNRSGIVVVNTA